MISEFFHSKSSVFLLRLFTSCLLPLISILSLSCNQPFQPQVEYTPKLVLYSVLFANETGVYVRVTSTEKSPDGKISMPIHGALVLFETYSFSYIDSTYKIDSIRLIDTTVVTDSGTASFYFANVSIYSGMNYVITASKEGYDPVFASVSVPYSSVTIPDLQGYSVFRHPDGSTTNPEFVINLGYSTVAYFYQVVLEYRGFNTKGQFQMGYVDVLRSTAQNPFKEVSSYLVSGGVDLISYDGAFHYAESAAGNLKQSHLYLDIIVTKIDDPLYRFFITSGRFANPLAMRTDKIIFSNVMNGVGLVGAAAVDTTRIYLF